MAGSLRLSGNQTVSVVRQCSYQIPIIVAFLQHLLQPAVSSQSLHSNFELFNTASS